MALWDLSVIIGTNSHKSQSVYVITAFHQSRIPIPCIIVQNVLRYNSTVNRSLVIIDDTGYPHDGRADNAAYRHDRRADKRRYRHDGEIDIQNVKCLENGYILS